MNNDCLICKRIDMIKNDSNSWFVAELKTGYVVLGDTQYFPGYTLFLAKNHVTELHYMEPSEKAQFLLEMSWVSEACSVAFNADKMNVEMLGNGDSHAHWHIIPRHDGDTPTPGPIWWVDPEVMYAPETAPTQKVRTEFKRRLRSALVDVLAENKQVVVK